MKRIRIVQAALLIGIVAVLSSCGSSRDYHGRSYPPARTDVSLIIGSSPGLVTMRHSNGMYYYRDQRGLTYWRGYDNRYYLDRRYISRSNYGHRQYNDWKRYHKNNGRRGRR
jgi:hypothetical protein